MSDAEVIAEIRSRVGGTISTRPHPGPTEAVSALRVGDVDRLLEMVEMQRSELAAITVCETDGQPCHTTHHGGCLCHEQRHAAELLDAMTKRAEADTIVACLTRQNTHLADVARVSNQQCDAAEAERDALRRIVDSECPIGALDLVTSLRVEKQQTMDALIAADAELTRLLAIATAAREYVQALRAADSHLAPRVAGDALDNAEAALIAAVEAADA